jgi:hypothetical protein
MRGSNRRRKLIAAIVVSVIFNCCWASVQALTGGPEKEEVSFVYKVTEICAMPGALMTVLLGQPHGHDVPSAVISVLITIAVSIGFYATVAWLIMILVGRLRTTVHFSSQEKE